jgi:thymidine kinase
MYSGKTEELIRRARRARIAKLKVQMFKPAIDVRYTLEKVQSHNGLDFEAVPVASAHELEECIDSDTQVVAIDEVQFFDSEIVAVVLRLASKGIQVLLAGLDRDFRGEPFGEMPRLLTYAEDCVKLHAICMVCGEEASYTQRIVNGIPANYNEPIIKIGAQESYEARCRAHHEVPGKPV